MSTPGTLPVSPGDKQGNWLHADYERGGTGSEHEKEDADEEAGSRTPTAISPGWPAQIQAETVKGCRQQFQEDTDGEYD